ncbi:aminodeoxychorismate synthase component I [Xanthomonas sp. A2111]|uniref:aminodeoxychorismate synthase n=1 Tax=Xanthomonas hawaiiensis TaxID=3003247 RepID=A0ABU2IAI9_9XANT|nr:MULTISPECIES: aminodeoxychorismate synthase component I [unclassified Xanthomonas]MDS9995160.1 aminodeoxychorismate synthase component I [Xanthomonas sp. A2111]WNH46923.1 aminodeoxychorismate synthase component I [Xanthomonas sp. A6251]
MQLQTQRIESNVQPQEVFTELFGDDVHAFWLDSSSHNQTNARFSYLGNASGPHAEVLEYRSEERHLRILDRNGVVERRQDILSYLQNELALRARPTPDDCPFEFNTGYVGYFGYELKGELQGAYAHPSTMPDACWIFADRTIVYDHQTSNYWILCLNEAEGLSEENRLWVEHVKSVLHRSNPPQCREILFPVRSFNNPQWRHSPELYLDLIRRAMQLITEGETYEVCLTNELSADIDANPLQVYQSLRKVNPVPFGAFLRFDDVSVLCASPELYLDVGTDGTVESKPIKGTAPRHSDAQKDRAIATRLASSVKDRSENLMIVDLLRNDLNRCCEFGSVHVPNIFQIESFSTVHQLVSTIRGKLKLGRNAIDCVRESFPGGSMTGAPKVRTMSIIDQLENGPRGVYSGSIGYLSVNGSARLNIVIRTIVMKGRRATIGAGGAIVALSNPGEELDEIMLKARAQIGILQNLAGITPTEQVGFGALSSADEDSPVQLLAAN